MKNHLLLLLALITINNVFAQENFVWEKTDSVAKTKEQIYSDTKMFIAEYWKSAKSVIQNDDKEGGLILVKGIVMVSRVYALYPYEYTYSYNVTFRMKNSKYKITIDNVYCESANIGDVRKLKVVHPFEGDDAPDMKSGLGGGLPKKKLIEVMTELKNRLQMITDEYSEYLNKSHNSDW